MRIALLFISITLFSLSGAFALESKCNFCSQANADYFQDKLSSQDHTILSLSFINSDNQVFIASEKELIEDIPSASIEGDKEIKPLQSITSNIENILEFIKESENTKSIAEKNIDLLANFRNGDDIVVRLGFLLFVKKNF